MASVDDFKPCFIKEVPPHLREEAARIAAEINPSNAPPAPLPGVDEPASLAVLKSAYWGPSPRTLSVSFMEDHPLDVKQRILSHMNAWECAVSFELLPAGKAGDVRITLRPRLHNVDGGFWSYLGTNILTIPKNEPTMCLEDIDREPDSEWRRVIRHETGHTLGFEHEHLRKEVVGRIDPDKAYAYFAWDRAKTYYNVLSALDPNSIDASAVDTDSIMCYQLPGTIMRDGQPVLGGGDINGQDAAFCHTLYPKPEDCTYTIVSGDTLFAIASRRGTTVDAILALNPGIVPTNLQIGQVINVPCGSGGGGGSGCTYTIVSGDTLYAIASRRGTNVKAIMALNPGIVPTNLQIGQVINVPCQ